jgi:hypothetical protein
MTFYPHIVRTVDELRKVIEDYRDHTKVELAEGLDIPAKTVGGLRALGSFPSGYEKLRILIPRPYYPESVVKIELPD